MLVLGIDPGSHHTGWSAVELVGGALRLRGAGTLTPGSSLPLARRLAAIHAGLAAVIAELSPVAASVEDVFHAQNARAALVLGQARGVALAAAASAGLDVHAYTAPEIKRGVTGNGRADKQQVARMVSVLLGGALPGDEHACDATAAAICHLHRARRPGLAGTSGSARAGGGASGGFVAREAVILPGGVPSARIVAGRTGRRLRASGGRR